MQVCTLFQTDNHASTSPLSFFTGRMLSLPPNQQRQSTEGHFRASEIHLERESGGKTEAPRYRVQSRTPTEKAKRSAFGLARLTYTYLQSVNSEVRPLQTSKVPSRPSRQIGPYKGPSSVSVSALIWKLSGICRNCVPIQRVPATDHSF